MSDITVEDILKIKDELDKANVPEYGRVAAITDENGTIIVSGHKFAKECWTVTNPNKIEEE